jgi:hypothetical protein
MSSPSQWLIGPVLLRLKSIPRLLVGIWFPSPKQGEDEAGTRAVVVVVLTSEVFVRLDWI